VAGDQEGEELVADLGVAHRRAVLVAGGDQEREDVVALLQVGGGAALGDLGGDQVVDPVDAAPEGRDRADPVRAERQHRPEEAGVGGEVEEAAERRAQPLEAGAAVDAEDRLDDDLERDRLHPRAQPVRGAGRPALDLAGGDRLHLLAVALHALAVERRQQQPALADVALLVEHEDRVLAEQRPQDLVALARVEDPGVAGEDLLDHLGLGDDHPVLLVGDLQGEGRAEPGAALLEHPLRSPRPDRRLHHPVHPRAPRQTPHQLPARSGRWGSRFGHRLHAHGRA
jgi:endonuclease/exonuclease/phosphatase family metal-dependent hydrolase